MSEGDILDGAPRQKGGPRTRRDFLYIATGAVGALGTALVIWPLIDSMNPSADQVALSSVEIDLAPIELGQRVTAIWRGQPLFIDHRTDERIEAARADDGSSDLIDSQNDEERVLKPDWLVVIGICTHLGCIPLGQAESDPHGNWDGWFCQCHGSQYDTSGRVRKGPAPRNLVVPSYTFVTDTLIRVG